MAARRKGQVLSVAAMVIALGIISTQAYFYSLEHMRMTTPYDVLSDHVLSIEQGSQHVLASSMFGDVEGWLSDYEKRVRIVIDHNDFDDNLTDFPLLVHLSTSSGRNGDDVSFVFDEMQSDSNRGKIAVITENGLEQCYVEVEEWDDASEEAWLWVRVPNISSTTDTVLYMYYGRYHEESTDYVGDPNSTPAEMVWDANFSLATHMRDDPDTSHVRDSTQSDNDGTKEWSWEPAYTSGGSIDGAQSFDGNDDDIDAGDIGSDGWTAITVEAWIFHDELGDDQVVCKSTDTGVSDHLFSLGVTGNVIRVRLSTDGVGGGTSSHDSDLGVHAADRWEYVVFTWDSADATIRFYTDGGSVGNASRDGDAISDSIQDVCIGNVYPGASSDSSRNFDGIIDEVRISNVSRDAAWIRASYESGIDDVLDFEAEETRQGNFSGVYSADLAVNLGRWQPFVSSHYLYGSTSVNLTERSQSPYVDGVWLDWGEDGSGVTSVAADATLNISGRGAEVDWGFTVNVTTSLQVSGSFLDLGGDTKTVTVVFTLMNEGSPALLDSKAIFYPSSWAWADASLVPGYHEQDYKNGTYSCTFTDDVAGAQVPVRLEVYDRRGMYVVAEATLPEG
ncbi:MAG TPA: DUF2341 domain-containing protein [Patescibacteria group bacterium]|nr:DUF2341 domain-containing protein [Patescibacteria group bacterium]